MNSRHTPLLWVAVPLVLGMLLHEFMAFDTLIAAVSILLLLIVLFVWRWRYLLYQVVFLVGYIIAAQYNVDTLAPHLNRDSSFIVELTTPRTATILSMLQEDGSWAKCRAKVLVSGVEEHQRQTIIVRGSLSDVEPSLHNYNWIMHHKGYGRQIDVSRVISELSEPKLSLSQRLNQWGYDRLKRLCLNSDSFALASATTIARREELTDQIAESYNLCGTTHLLALSGLHIGIVILLFSSLTYFLTLLRCGHIIEDLVLILAVWLFAMMAGLGESVTRAACMFTALGLSRIFSRRYSSLNSLLAAVIIIVCCDHEALYDVGFMLSVVAVAAIIIVGAPLGRLLSCGYKPLDFLTMSLSVSLAATFATAPLTSYTFGYLSLLGPLTTIPLLLTTTIIIFGSLLWIIFPLQPLAYLLRPTIEFATSVQNYIVDYIASHAYGFIDYSLSRFELVVSYFFLFIFISLVGRLIARSYREKSISATFEELNRKFYEK